MSQQEVSLKLLLDSDSELSSLPEIYIRISELLDNENSASVQIGQVVETDPALTSRILKMVNSAFYGYPSKISTISQAIAILGRDRLRQILIGSMLGGVFGNISNKAFFMKDFWNNSVKTAILVRHLCHESPASEQAETLFTAGLLHEIGRLILAQKLPEHSLQVQNAIDLEDEDLCQAENRIIGFTHCDTGAAFINKWGLPAILSDIAKFHHTPQLATEFNAEIRLVYLASNLTFLVTPIQQQEVEFALEDIKGWQEVGLSLEQITHACILAEEQVYEVMESLGMGQMKIESDE